MSLKGRAAIVGIGELRPTRYTEGETTIGMLTKAGLLAIEDSGLPFDEIDGLLVHPVAGAAMFVPSTFAEFLGLQVNFAEIVDLGGATGAGMVWRAAAAISEGLCRTCLCLTGARRELRRSRERGGGVQDRTPYAEFEAPYGAIGANFGYAMIDMVEETMEMAGSSLFLYTLLEYLGTIVPEMRVRVQSATSG